MGTHLHRPLIDKKAIQLGSCLVGTTRFAEDDRCNATTGTVRTVREGDSLDWTDRFDKIFLYQKRRESY